MVIAGQVVGIARPSRRRKAVVGILKEEGVSTSGGGLLFLMPRDARLPRAVVQVQISWFVFQGQIKRVELLACNARGHASRFPAVMPNMVAHKQFQQQCHSGLLVS